MPVSHWSLILVLVLELQAAELLAAGNSVELVCQSHMEQSWPRQWADNVLGSAVRGSQVLAC